MSKTVDTWFVCYGNTVIDTFKVDQTYGPYTAPFFTAIRYAYATILNLPVGYISVRYKGEIGK